MSDVMDDIDSERPSESKDIELEIESVVNKQNKIMTNLFKKMFSLLLNKD